MAKTFKVKLVRSVIGCTQSQRDTVRCLGIRRLQHEVTVTDTPANRGQIFKVQHLVQVKVEK
jgi:large subunit ribosomal protein L30